MILKGLLGITITVVFMSLMCGLVCIIDCIKKKLNKSRRNSKWYKSKLRSNYIKGFKIICGIFVVLYILFLGFIIGNTIL